MERIGTGKGVAALLNGRAKRVTPRVVHALENALPDALILVSGDQEQARRHVRTILDERPSVVLSGGGDGSAVRLLNLMRDLGGGAPFPPVGLLKLGTGNGWANSAGAVGFQRLVKSFRLLPRELPTRPFDLVEVEGTLCQFAGTGWDARVLNDYQRNLDKRSAQLFGSRFATRLHKGLGGYFYSLARITVPSEAALLLRHGQAQITLENLGALDDVYTLDAQGAPILFGGRAGLAPEVLFEGPVSIAIAGTSEQFGFGLKAFPNARAKPGYLNIRVYDRPVFEGIANMVNLWRGISPLPGVHEFFVRRARMSFSRPMPFQIGGDPAGSREHVTFGVADHGIQIVDWTQALEAARCGPPEPEPKAG